MEYKKLNSALLLTVIILLVTTILVLIKVLFSGAKGFEWGSVSDWFSAIFNGIVAFTALGALLKASNYLQNKLTEEDISLWLQINDNVSSIASSVTVLWLLYERMINQWQKTEDTDILKYHYLNYLTYYNNFTAQLHKLHDYNHRVSLRKKPYSKRNELISLTKELSNFNRVITYQVHNIITILTQSSVSNQCPENIKEQFIDGAKEHLSNPLLLNANLQKTYYILRKFGIDDHYSHLSIREEEFH